MRTRPEFSFDRPFQAAVSGGLVYGGRRYTAGEVFPWTKLGVSEIELWDLWLTCQIDNVVPGAMIALPAKHGLTPKEPQRR